MTIDPDEVSTPVELSEALDTLLRRAHENGVDVEGGWECLTDGGDSDWDVVVTEVDGRGASEEGHTSGRPAGADE